MAETGFRLVVPQEMIDRLAVADEKIEKIAKTSEDAQKRIDASFKAMANGGINEFIEKLNQAQQALTKVGSANVQGGNFSELAKNAKVAADDVNRLAEVLNKLPKSTNSMLGSTATTQNNTSFDNILNNYKQKIDTLKREMDIFKQWESGNLLNTQDYAHIGRVADEVNKLMVAYEALYQMQKKMGRNTFQEYIGGLGGNSIQDQQSQHILNRMREFYQEQDKLARQQAKEQAKIEEQKRKELEKTAKEAERLARQQAKEESRMRRNDYNRYVSTQDTYDHAMRVSGRAKTINQELKAIRTLEQARANLNKTDTQYEQKLRNLNAAILQHKRNIDKATQGSKNLQNSHKGLMNISEQLTRRLALVFSVSQITGYINKLISVRGEFELQQRSLQAILQNKDEADKLWQQTVDLAARSPFRVKELVTYTKQLAAYRVETEKLHDTTRMLSDVSAGLGVDMQRLILAFGQVKAANYLRGTELRQFSEAGINILGELATYFTELEGRVVSVGDVFERVSKRMVAFSDVEEIFKRLTSEGGTFYRMQEIQSETLKGMLSNLQDSIDLMLNDIGKSNEGTIKNMVSLVKVLVDNWKIFASALKGIIYIFGLYKLNVLLASDAMKLLAIDMRVLNTTIPKQLTLLQLANVGWRKLQLSIGNAGKALKTFAASNVVLLALTAIALAIHEWVTWNNELNEQLDKVNEKREEELSQINKITRAYQELNKAQKGSDGNDEKVFKDKLKYLQQLQNTIGESGVNVPLSLGTITKENVDEAFIELENRIRYAKDWGRDLAVEFAKGFSGAEGWFNIFGDNLLTDLQELDNASAKVTGALKSNLDRVVTELQSVYPNLSEEARYYLQYVEQGRGADETEEEWFEHKVTLLRNIANLYPQELRNIGYLEQAERKIATIEDKRLEVQKEIDKVLYRMRSKYGVNDFAQLSGEQKVLLKTEIDKIFEQQELNAQTQRFAAHYVANKLKIPFTLVEDKDSGKGLLDWQNRFNEFIKTLGKGSVRAISNVETTRETLRKSIQDEIKSYQDIVDAYNVKGQEAYSTAEMEEAERKIKDLTQAYVWLGGATDSLGKKDKKNEQIKILNNRISLVKELNKKYKELNKTFDDTTSKEQIFKSYSDTFKEAFKDTGINLSGLQIDTTKLDELKQEGEKAGQVFSDSMTKKMEEVIASGTYIRQASAVFQDTLKQDEGLEFVLYDDKTKKAIRNAEDFANKVGTATIGFGHAVFDIKEATKYFGKVLSQAEVDALFEADLKKHQDALNEVLDNYNELILTQEQYDVLLNKTYQGGSGAIQSAINYAINIEDGLKHFETLSNKLKAVGKNFVNVFGVDFIDKFKQAQSVSERLALVLQTINLTTKASGGNIDVDLFEGMLKRSKKVAAQFSGDLNLVKLLEKASINISQIDFTNIEGVIATLKRLQPLAEKEGKEAQLALSKAISELEAQIGVDVKVKEDKALLDQIEEMFSGYEVSLELQKLNIPNDWAKEFFGIDTFDLGDIRKKIEQQLATGNYGEKTREELEKDLKKVEEMEVKAQQERLKKYLQYARDAIGDRAKIKFEEMKKLQEIEETFTSPEQEEVKQKAIAKVRKDSEQEQNKLDWEEFQKSDTFMNLFSDLDSASSALIDHSLKKLREFKEQWKDMPMEDMRAIVQKINELELALAASNPFEGVRDLNRLIKQSEQDAKFASVDAQKFAKQSDYASAFAIEREYQEQRAQAAQQEISDIETIIRAKEEGQNLDEVSLNLSRNQQLLSVLSLDTLKGMLQTQKDQKSNAEQQVANSNEYLTNLTKQQKKLQGQSDAIQQAQQMANDLYGAFKDLNDVLGGTDSVGAIFADMGMNMLNTVMNCLALQVQLEAASIGATKFGAAMNAAMGIIGWIVMAVQLISQILGAIFAAHDKRLENQIESLQEKVDELNKELETLEKQLDKAFNVRQLQQYTNEINRNINAQINAYEQMIKLEEDKKKTDKGKINDYKESIEELRQTQKELQEEAVSTATSGILDSVRDAARDFVDAWYDAFSETGDGLQGLKDNFREVMLEMVQQQASMTIAGNFLDRWKKQLDKYINPNDLELATQEAKAWVDSVQKELPMLNEALEEYFRAMEQAGVDLSGTTNDMSGLQRGIQSVSEETAQALEALLNSMRFYVADSNLKLTQLVNSFTNSETPNPILSELRSQSEMIRAIRDMFSSVIGRGSTTHSGAYLKVAL